jgi:hypothetical protein
MERVPTSHVLAWAPCQVWEAKGLGVVEFEGVDLFMRVGEHGRARDYRCQSILLLSRKITKHAANEWR